MTRTRPTFAVDMTLYVEEFDGVDPTQMIRGGVNISEYCDGDGMFEAYVEGYVFGDHIPATYWQPAETPTLEITRVSIGDVDFTDELTEQARYIIDNDPDEYLSAEWGEGVDYGEDDWREDR